jgi:hypothetical protein
VIEKLFFTFCTERRGRVVNTPASYSRGPGFKTWLGNRLSWLMLFVVLLIPTTPGYCLKIRPRHLPSKCFPIHHHSLITFHWTLYNYRKSASSAVGGRGEFPSYTTCLAHCVLLFGVGTDQTNAKRLINLELIPNRTARGSSTSSLPVFRNHFFTHGTPIFNNGSWGHTTEFCLTERGYETVRSHKKWRSYV